MFKKILLIVSQLWISVLVIGQCVNTDQFEMRTTVVSASQVVVEMRAVGSVIPTNAGACMISPDGTNTIIADLTFSLFAPIGVTMNAVLAFPCGFGPFTGYGVANAGAPITLSGASLQGFNQSLGQCDAPVTWVLNTWTPVCTVNVGSNAAAAVEVVACGTAGLSFDPNIDIIPLGGGAVTSYSPMGGVSPLLGLELVSFDADKYKERSSLLKWVTVDETNTSYFSVQRSTDRMTWSEVGKVQAAGNSATELKYQFIDENVYDGRSPVARYYYRLDMVDSDGRAQKSNIDVVQFSSNIVGASVYVFPNPSTDGVNVELNYTEEDSAPAQMHIYNDLGQLVYSREIAEGSSIEFIDYQKINIFSGTYTLQVMDQTNGILATEKLVVQR